MLGSDEYTLTPEQLEALRQAPQEIASSPYSACLCGKLLNVTEWSRKWHSGRWKGTECLLHGINYTDLLCLDCRKEFKAWPRIVCIGCRSLMGFYKPGKQSTGFAFERDRHYHILDCPKCNPKSRSTSVVEHEQFCKMNGVPTTANLDLLQEIEQKVLQAERAAGKMREEFKASSKPK